MRGFLPCVLFSLLAPAALPAQEIQAWLDEVSPLITAREREAFLRLAGDADRQAFIQGFWQVRDPYPETARNEARERWEERLPEARRRWQDPRDERARVFLIAGEPDATFEARCADTPLEVWTYEPRFQVKDRMVLFFLAGGPARLWYPAGVPDLKTLGKDPCAAEPPMKDAVLWVRLEGRDGYELLAKRVLAGPKPREWVSAFRPPSAEARQADAVLGRSGGSDPVVPEAAVALVSSQPDLRILAPGGSMLAGAQRFEVRVERAAGLADEEQIASVAFTLDGKPVLTRTRPPYVAELDLGQAPRSHALAVEGLNGHGEVVATDELAINAGAQRFAVRLREPRPGRAYRRSLRARVEVEAPADRRVERVELYLGETRVATLYQPPYAQALSLPEGAETGYVRAVGYLSDGTKAEDLVLLNTQAAAVEEMNVRLVELYTNVVDRAGKPIDGIDAGELEILEDGVRQPLRRFERATGTPLRLVTLIDNSASMRPRLEATRLAALQFLRGTLKPADQAAVITFNRVPRVAVSLTGDLAVLEDGLSGLVAEEKTSLYDSVIFALHYLGGATGQKAVLLLSDGEDRTSGFHFEDVLESARRAGIAVYAIGLDLPKGEASRGLARLAAETGGRSFFLKATADLAGAYREIESDLRARYRLSYQSSNTSPGDAFRSVQVKVARPGAAARTISGYYP